MPGNTSGGKATATVGAALPTYPTELVASGTHAGMWGAHRRSCSSPVLVEETAEQVASEHPAFLTLTDDGQLGGSVRRLELERPVWTVPVVVLDVDPKDLLQMAAPDEQQPIQALGAGGADPPFCVRVRGRRPHGRHQHLGTLRAEHVVEAAGELRVPVADQEAYLPSPLPQHQQQVAGLLGDPGAVGIGGHAGQVHTSRVQFDEEQDVEPPQEDRVRGEEVARHDPGGLLAQERPPGGGRPPWRGSSPWRRSAVRIAVAETCTPSRCSSPLIRW